MADTSARMLRLLSMLQLHRHWRGDELAERLDVSERTLRRDIDRLRGLGYPVESLPGVSGGYQLSAGSALPPMVFDHDEAIALAVGLRDVSQSTDQPTAEASLRALAKLTAMLPAAVRQKIELVSSVTDTNPMQRRLPPPAADVLGAIAQACRDVVRVNFDYETADGVRSQRYAEPYRLVTLGQRWYLVAFDLDRNDWRTFRVDRAANAIPARNSFSPRPLPATDLARYVDERIREIRPSIEVEFVVHASAEHARRSIGRWATIVDGPRPNTSRVLMTTDSFDWPVVALANLGVDFEVVRPLAFRAQLAAFANRIEQSPQIDGG
jgi:predicted DNA-binding transcriptional regulator YafY